LVSFLKYLIFFCLLAVLSEPEEFEQVGGLVLVVAWAESQRLDEAEEKKVNRCSISGVFLSVLGEPWSQSFSDLHGKCPSLICPRTILT